MIQKVISDNNIFRFKCPNCNTDIEVLKQQTNCRIFRCGIYKRNGNPIPPHTKKEECDRLFNNNLIYGCSKPFKFVYSNTGNYVETCGYI